MRHSKWRQMKAHSITIPCKLQHIFSLLRPIKKKRYNIVKKREIYNHNHIWYIVYREKNLGFFSTSQTILISISVSSELGLVRFEKIMIVKRGVYNGFTACLDELIFYLMKNNLWDKYFFMLIHRLSLTKVISP